MTGEGRRIRCAATGCAEAKFSGSSASGAPGDRGIRTMGAGHQLAKGLAMFALVVRFDIRDAESAKRFDELTVEAVRMIKEREPGTLVYATP